MRLTIDLIKLYFRFLLKRSVLFLFGCDYLQYPANIDLLNVSLMQ